MLHHSATLFSAVSATGNGAAVSWPGGNGVLTAFGTFGGTALTLEFTPSVGTGAGTWVPVSTPPGVAVSMTAPGQAQFVAPVGNLRGVLTGGVPASLSATVGTVLL